MSSQHASAATGEDACVDAFAALFGGGRGGARPAADGALTPADREALARFLVFHPHQGDYLVARAMSADGSDDRVALYYDAELIAYCKVGSLVVASEGLSDVAARVREELVETARSFGAGVRFTRRLSELLAAPVSRTGA